VVVPFLILLRKRNGSSIRPSPFFKFLIIPSSLLIIVGSFKLLTRQLDDIVISGSPLRLFGRKQIRSFVFLLRHRGPFPFPSAFVYKDRDPKQHTLASISRKERFSPSSVSFPEKTSLSFCIQCLTLFPFCLMHCS